MSVFTCSRSWCFNLATGKDQNFARNFIETSMDVSSKIGGKKPQNGWFISWENPIKMVDLGWFSHIFDTKFHGDTKNWTARLDLLRTIMVDLLHECSTCDDGTHIFVKKIIRNIYIYICVYILYYIYKLYYIYILYYICYIS